MQSDTVQIVQLGWGVLQALVTFAVWLYAWTAARGRARQDELQALRVEHDKRIQDVQRDADTLKERIAHLPTAAEVSALQATLAGIKAMVETVDARTTRIEDFLSHQRAAV